MDVVDKYLCEVLGLADCHMDLIVHEKKCINYNANVYMSTCMQHLSPSYCMYMHIKNCIIYNNHFSLYANSILTCTHSIIHVYVPELKHLIKTNATSKTISTKQNVWLIYCQIDIRYNYRAPLQY